MNIKSYLFYLGGIAAGDCSPHCECSLLVRVTDSLLKFNKIANKPKYTTNQIKNIKSVVSVHERVRHCIGYFSNFHECYVSVLIVSRVSISMCLHISVCYIVFNVMCVTCW